MKETAIHRIVRLREAKGLSQRQLAEVCGVSYGTIQSWEQHPDEKLPSVRLAQKVADALETTTNYILFGEANNQIMVIEEFPETSMPKSLVKEIITKMDKLYTSDKSIHDDILMTINDHYHASCEKEEGRN